MARYFISDIHLRHRKVNLIRGFALPDGEADFDAHSDAIAEAWDSVVQPDDEVFLTGDCSMNSGQHVFEWMDARPGRKHLFAGNHDSVHPMHQTARKVFPEWSKHFETIQTVGTIQLEGQKVLISHFPYWSWGDGPTRTKGARYPEWRVPEVPGRLLIHGHTHGPEQAHDNQFHVGWDAWGRLVTEGEISAWVRERIDAGQAYATVRED